GLGLFDRLVGTAEGDPDDFFHLGWHPRYLRHGFSIDRLVESSLGNNADLSDLFVMSFERCRGANPIT
ncbi:MAG: hypothetical protein WBO84_09400, partial [Acidimicrobiia bacterium]